jgi:hypothetical protein
LQYTVEVPAIALQPMPAASLFSTERALVRDCLVNAGLSVLVERLPMLAVLHVWADAGGVERSLDGETLPDPWRHAQAWWYPV